MRLANADSYCNCDSNRYGNADGHSHSNSNRNCYGYSYSDGDTYSYPEGYTDAKATSNTAAASVGRTANLEPLRRELARETREFPSLRWKVTVAAAVSPATSTQAILRQ
jgi:hypothetical protein